MLQDNQVARVGTPFITQDRSAVSWGTTANRTTLQTVQDSVHRELKSVEHLEQSIRQGKTIQDEGTHLQ